MNGNGGPQLKDWLGWLVAGVLTIIVALGGRLWSEQERRIAEQAERINELERVGTPAMRANVASLEARISYLQQMVDMNGRQLEYLTRMVSQPPEPRSGPRFER